MFDSSALSAFGVIVALLSPISVGRAQPAAPRAMTRLPHGYVRSLEILPGDRVRLRTHSAYITRVSADGNEEIEDRSHINADDGTIEPDTAARPATEIVLARGEACAIGAMDPWVRIVFLRVEGGRVIVRLVGVGRAGSRPFNYVASIAPYSEP